MENLPHATDDDRATIAKIVKAAKVGLLTTVSPDGQLHSRPLVAQDVEFDGDLWFFAQDDSAKVRDIAAHGQVNVAFESGKGYLSLAGTATVVRDEQKIEEYWSPGVEAWFPEGREDPTVALIRVHAETAEYWANDEPRIVSAFKIAKAAVGGGQPDVGENRTVDLS
ncbi:pyridoxamine 5'-phosphate oxidase family protein [Microbacterium marinilacus]|uniref:Pyridoxamine 5'-phosphate oxidase family protein n=1 Tax=Microbacterium marinilacus TaxID=415209 RepID=A0ABP7B7K1_9MICO|nr:pyridoxamine 5'-phosphate oxidase family protein [Microbacterium marinilacus]MBY0689942.1 pyridoxamine 5'-phosphate oxidase family protein [Microbacterium marinilacus]